MLVKCLESKILKQMLQTICQSDKQTPLIPSQCLICYHQSGASSVLPWEGKAEPERDSYTTTITLHFVCCTLSDTLTIRFQGTNCYKKKCKTLEKLNIFLKP